MTQYTNTLVTRSSSKRSFLWQLWNKNPIISLLITVLILFLSNQTLDSMITKTMTLTLRWPWPGNVQTALI